MRLDTLLLEALRKEARERGDDPDSVVLPSWIRYARLMTATTTCRRSARRSTSWRRGSNGSSTRRPPTTSSRLAADVLGGINKRQKCAECQLVVVAVVIATPVRSMCGTPSDTGVRHGRQRSANSGLRRSDTKHHSIFDFSGSFEIPERVSIKSRIDQKRVARFWHSIPHLERLCFAARNGPDLTWRCVRRRRCLANIG